MRKNYSLRRKFKKCTVHVVEATMELKATRQIFPRLLVSGDQMSVQITCGTCSIFIFENDGRDVISPHQQPNDLVFAGIC